MRYAIVSDIHGNLEALQAVLTDCQKEGLKKFFCLGDIVGYGADPVACLNEIKQLDVQCVAGNHDWAVAERIEPTHFNPLAKEAVLWTREILNLKDKAYLKGLELCERGENFVLVHATWHDPEQFIYLNDIAESRKTFAVMEQSICFVGHTHVPIIFIEQNHQVRISDQDWCSFEQGKKYIVNVGSVGQPRDRNPKAAYGIYDTENASLELRRIPYDIAKAQDKILNAGLPMSLAYRLALGY